MTPPMPGSPASWSPSSSVSRHTRSPSAIGSGSATAYELVSEAGLPAASAESTLKLKLPAVPVSSAAPFAIGPSHDATPEPPGSSWHE